MGGNTKCQLERLRGPSMWKEYTNDLPESCKGVDPGEGEDGEDGEDWGNPVEANPKTSGEFREENRQGEIGRETGPRPREPEEEAQDDGGGEGGGCWGNLAEANLKPGGGQEDRKEDWELSHWIDSKPVHYGLSPVEKWK